MMQSEIDWRHIAAAAVVVVGLLFAGFKLLVRPSAVPNAAAPGGVNRRVEDVPEQVGQPSPGTATALPTAR